jgi:BirA family biotin operon repressor/biotin-[acetyl-CoA-carboxylase] ligase
MSQWTDLGRPPLRRTALARALTEGPDPAWRAIEVVNRTGSTNADLAARARAGEPEGLVLAADHQAAGRGRLGREWEAPPRAGLAVSVLLRPPVDPARWSWLPLLAGVAVVEALTRVCGVPAGLKWPNDVLVPEPVRGRPPEQGERRKVCGVLVEAVPGADGGPAAAVLGFGLNVDQDRNELPVPRATSLRLAGAATLDRDTVLRACLRALAVRYRRWLDAGGDPRASGVAPAYREACLTLGQEVEVHLPGREPLRGVAEGVDDDGRLVVATPDGRREATAAGDVVHVRPAAARG